MKGKRASRAPVMVFDHEFTRKLDEHINDRDNPRNLTRLAERFKKKKASTRKILKYFREEKIITKDLEKLIRKHWVRERDDCGDYGCLVSDAQSGFRAALKKCAGSGGPSSNTRFEMGAKKFGIESWRDGETVEIRIRIPEFTRDTIMYKAVRDPGFIEHFQNAAAHAGRLAATPGSSKSTKSKRGK